MTLHAAALLLALTLAAFVTALVERRASPFALSARAGPVAVSKTRQVPSPADRWMHAAAPVLALAGVGAAAVVVPLAPGWIGADLDIGVFYLLVMVDLVVVGLSMAGWGGGSANAVESFYRACAQLVAYLVPAGLAYVGAIMIAGSLSTVEIVERQAGRWNAVAQPVGFVLYLVCALLQSYRAPFDAPFSASIDGGVLGEARGWQSIAWRIALDGLLFVACAMGVVLYLGGWRGPLLPAPVWMLAKTFALMAALLWLGRRFRSMTVSRMLRLSWLVLTPVGLVNVLLVGTLILAERR